MSVLDQPLDESVQYASFAERLAARIVDVLILFIPNAFVPFIVPFLYFTFMESSEQGATVGKRALGLRVVSEKSLEKIEFGTAALRFLAQIINAFTLGIGYLIMLFSEKKQGLHDILAGTVVVRVKSVPHVGQTQTAPPRKHERAKTMKRSWSAKAGENEMHFIEIDRDGGRHWHRSPSGETVNDFTLWQLTDNMVDFSQEFGPEINEEMKQYAETLLRNQA